MLNLRKHWKTVQADDQDGQDDDGTTMETLNDGVAQELCKRLWMGYVTNDLTNFDAYMQQIDQITTQFVQSLPTPVDPSNLEDSELPVGEFDLPGFIPETSDDSDAE